MLRRISLGSARNCSRAFSLISIRYRTAGILLRRWCAGKPAHPTHAASFCSVLPLIDRVPLFSTTRESAARFVNYRKSYRPLGTNVPLPASQKLLLLHPTPSHH